MIFDTHCHLNSEELYSRLDEVIAASKAAGVQYFLVAGWNKESSLLAVELAEKYDFIYAAVGFHPENISEINESDFDLVMGFLSHKKVVSVGEIGLDYHWTKDEKTRELQRFYFEKQIKEANKWKKSIIVHNRDAFQDCLTVLKTEKPLYGGVMHCYAGSAEALNEVIKLGMYIGLGGTLTFTNAKTPKEVCKVVPLDKLVVETDAPYLAPHPLRGSINEPKNITLVVDEICKLREMNRSELEDILLSNSLRLFHV